MYRDDFEPPEAGGKVAPLLPLHDLSVGDLLTLRGQIDELLPARTLSDLNLADELVMQYQVAKALQTETLAGHDEANRKAQVVNTTSATLQALVKTQTDFHNSERFKKLESLMLASLKLMPAEVASKFIDEYAALAAQA